MNGPSPMLAQSLQGDPPKGSVFEPKLNGWRVVVHKVGPDVEVYSRKFTDQGGKLPHIEAAFRAVPFDFTLDGEIVDIVREVKINREIIPVSNLYGVQCVMGSSPKRKLAKRFQLSFAVFDCLMATGKNGDEVLMRLPDLVRHEPAGLIVQALRAYTDKVFMVPRWHSGSDWSSLYGQVVSAGGEGLMVKNPLARYYPGQRPPGVWLKMKDEA